MRIPWTSDFAVNLNRHLAIRQCNDASFERQMLYPKRGYETRGHSIVNNLWHQKPLYPTKLFLQQTAMFCQQPLTPKASDTTKCLHRKPLITLTKRSHQQPFELDALFHRPKGSYTRNHFNQMVLHQKPAKLLGFCTKCCLRSFYEAFNTTKLVPEKPSTSEIFCATSCLRRIVCLQVLRMVPQGIQPNHISELEATTTPPPLRFIDSPMSPCKQHFHKPRQVVTTSLCDIKM